MPTSTVVRLVPKLSIAALKTDLDKELALRYCLGATDYWGSGCLGLQLAVGRLSLSFLDSESSAYRNLDSVGGIFGEERPMININRLQIKI